MNENLLSINENPLHTILLNQKKNKKKIQSNFRIPVRGPKLWNEIFSNFEKELTNTLLLKNRVNETMLKLNILLENILS